MKKTPLEDWIVTKTHIARDREALETFQLDKIRENLHYVKKNSLFYKEKLKEIEVEDITSFRELQKIHFTYPEDIKENPFSFLCVPQREVERIVTLNTSGTSGGEKRIFFSKEDLRLTIDFFQHGMNCLIEKEDRVLVLLPGNSLGSIGDLLKKALAISKIDCTVKGVLGDVEKTGKFIVDNNVNCIVGIPMQVQYLSRMKREIFKKRIEKVLLSTDYVPKTIIDELTNEYECKVFTHYGMTEMGYGGGVECQALNGYHMREGDLYFEIINPDTGQAVENGVYGEVVFTTLTRKAMPLIRYRTGDLAAFSSTPCCCGTFLQTMKKVLGRIENRVYLGNNEFLYLRELDEILLSIKEIMDYKAYIEVNNKLVLEIFPKDNEIFHLVRKELRTKLDAKLFYRFKSPLNIEIISNIEHKPAETTNSMMKRIIFDYRNYNQNATELIKVKRGSLYEKR